MEVNSFERRITNIKYKSTKKLTPGKWSRVLRKEISIEVRVFNLKEVKNDDIVSINDEFFVYKIFSNITPIVIGIIMLIIVIGLLFVAEDNRDIGFFIVFIISTILLLTCIIYFFTKPKKEGILDRINSKMTFPGFWWAKNYTMPFDKVQFILSSPSRSLSSHRLQIIRPDTFYTFDNNFAVENCYKDISFITWYMDKNRPLPPGTAFDPYRQRDFERRKAEGFPPPLYKSAIPTPEATLEQQKEREKYWKDYEHRPDPNNEDFAIPSI